jgi:menaquinone-dependent protoporphyrinogen IX oxidase
VKTVKALIVFYSRDGTTKKLAQEIAHALTCEVDWEELSDGVNRSGLFGWLRSGRDAMQSKLVDLAPLQHDPAAYDLVIVGTPVWSSKMTPAVRTFLTRNKDKLKEVALFATHGFAKSDTGYRVLHEMEQMCGKNALGTMQISSRDLRKGEHTLKAQNFAVEVSIF